MEFSGDLDLGQDRAHSARMYDYYLGGHNSYIVDREAADDVIAAFPTMGVAALVNRAYTQRAGEYLARLGVRQFIDVGAGFPFSPNFHEAVQAVTPEATVVYVDNDPIVLAYADSFADSTPEGTTCCVGADVRQPDELLTAVAQTGCIDFGRPVALSLHAVLDLLPDDTNPYQMVGRLMGRLSPGSYLSLSHCTGDFAPETWRNVISVYRRRGIRTQPRTKAEVLRFYRGLEIIEPGITVAHRWRPAPASGPSLVTDTRVSLYAGIARKSAASSAVPGRSL
ncbi:MULTISPECIES: SAM-dependent methyltransferase [unclassified Streptomyces]|uniref:SAM-dependent methyltransferase n=1 Tax=unclassified Streptomyces TaxID=2593676 RepID=UPI0036275BA7